jgi:hypothetical protein
MSREQALAAIVPRCSNANHDLITSHMQDYSLAGHQIVCHLVASDYRCPDFVNPVGT